jgi:NADPH:quinone reductase-like Zn-dependent oxidoreductase
MPEPGPGQVRVRMIASPVNPSDLLFVRGRYTVVPNPPATPGFEGVGIVDRAGPGPVGRFLVGRRVAAINGEGGDWAEYAVIPAFQAIPVPAALNDAQVASLFVNPATAVALIRFVLKVPKNAWLLQTAAGSTLGKMIIRLAKRDGIRTINVVRRPEAIDELRAMGADVVISTSNGPISEQIRNIVGNGVDYALDCVGGDVGTQVFESLSQKSAMIVYGSLTGQPIQIDPRRMISASRVVRGFWLGHWMRSRSKAAAIPFFIQVIGLIRDGTLASTPGPVYPLDRIHDAVIEAERDGRKGKVLLQIST